jgi:putative ABC transport system permease protein
MEKQFDLERNISVWKRGLRKSLWLDDGMILELEQHLRDQIDDLVYNGYSLPDAFQQAVKILGQVEKISQEESRNQFKHRSGTPFALWTHLVKVNLRRIFRYGFYNLINILGLALGITGFLLIGFYLNDEWNYDKMHPEYDKIYRLSYIRIAEDGSRQVQAYSSAGWPSLLKERHTGVEDYCRFLQVSHGYLSTENEESIFYEEGIYFTDPNFFQMFSFPMKTGNANQVIQNPNSIVLTETSVVKYFGDQDPVGRTLIFRQGATRKMILTVTGVMYNPPSNTQFHPDFVASFQSLRSFYGGESFELLNQTLRPTFAYSYLKIRSPELKPGIISELNSALKEGLGKEEASRIEPVLTPLTAIHFYDPPMRWEFDHSTSRSYLRGLTFIGIFILFIAMLNFINMSTAQALQKGKEVGVRSILGSSKFNLRLQFLIETMLLVITATILSFLIIYLIFPYFKLLAGKNFSLASLITQFKVLGIMIGIILGTGLLSGIYPSLYLSGFSPMKILRNTINLGRNTLLVRKGLVILQFAVAILMIISAMVIYNQLQLINQGALADNRNQVVSIRTRLMGSRSQAESYRQEIMRDSRIIKASLGMHLPRQADFGRIDGKFIVRELGKNELYWNKFESDGYFPETFDLELIAGHDFNQDVDSSSFILNEAAVQSLGIAPEDAIGLEVEEDSINSKYTHLSGTVIGVVKDFPYASIKEQVNPLLMVASIGVEGVLSVKLARGDLPESIKFLESEWKQIFPGKPFEYWFLDQEFNRLYFQEKRLGKLVPIFTGLAIVIALLGLFALTTFVTEQRSKEISIRKVLGSTAGQILKLLSWEFIRLILIAMGIAIPMAILIMQSWLENFAYRTRINVPVILIGSVIVLSLSMLTISYQAIKSALTNPARGLRTE